MKQMSFFDGTQKFRNDKPIRLIELFAGYGSQALALKYLGVQFEHYRISEWATKSIQAYKDLHATDDRTDYSQGLTLAEIKAWLTGKISTDYSTPATAEQIGRFSEKTARTLYNNMRATRNIGSITQATADDLAIVNTAEFLYIMTYSFPCQDLSAAGNGAGMGKGSGTRSGLLWEVERLLNEIARGGARPASSIAYGERTPSYRRRRNSRLRTVARVPRVVGLQKLHAAYERQRLRNTAKPKPLLHDKYSRRLRLHIPARAAASIPVERFTRTAR